MNPLRPGFTRSFVGMVVCGAAAGFLYRAFAEGQPYAIPAVLLLLQGLLFAGARGLVLGAVFNIPVYALLHFPVAPPTAIFGDILVTLVVYLAVVPTFFLIHAFITGKIWGAVISALAIVPNYAILLIAPTLISSAVPFLVQKGPGVHVGASLIFAGFGMAFGYLWGMGALSAGASAHEGPTYYAALSEAEKPRRRPVRELREAVTKALPVVREQIGPMIRPTITTLIVIAVVVGGIFFVATNPIVPVSRAQTFNSGADATAITGDKFLLLVVVTVVILGGLITLAGMMALVVSLINREVNTAKKEQKKPLEIKDTKFARVINFGLDWVRDLLNGIRGVFSR